ncbi:hypothetical protein F443_15445 [Phytophthora nicotianae P1569]|uniref:Uncharacterized protein n=1 Tax=Phytophthora nicotianae P1569 TaxID=1317065 RepID=V9EIE9_PHYNI|nr:hypothetical protein F443_15445 [Phytophthora nicotianae P1569]
MRCGAGWRDRGDHLHYRLLPLRTQHPRGPSNLQRCLLWCGSGYAVRCAGYHWQDRPDIRSSGVVTGIRRCSHQYLHVRVAIGYDQGRIGDQVVGFVAYQPVHYDLSQLLHVGGYVYRGQRHVRVDSERHRSRIQRRAAPALLHLPPYHSIRGLGCAIGRRLRHQDRRQLQARPRSGERVAHYVPHRASVSCGAVRDLHVPARGGNSTHSGKYSLVLRY